MVEQEDVLVMLSWNIQIKGDPWSTVHLLGTRDPKDLASGRDDDRYPCPYYPRISERKGW